MSEPSNGRSVARSAVVNILVLALYSGLAVAMFSDGLFGGHGMVVGFHGDTAIFIWNLEWLPFAIAHHLNPLVTYYEHYPSGANLMWNTSTLFPALVFAPITALFGPIASYNLLTVLGTSLSAWCAYLAIRRHAEGVAPAAAGGLLYGFSPFMYVQTLGHAQLFVAVFPPLLLLFGDEILVRQRRPPLLLGALLGVTTAAQLLTGEELLAITAIAAAPAVALVAILNRDQIRLRLRYAARALVTAALTFAVLAAVPLYVQFLGPQRVHGLLQGRDIYIATPQAFISPTNLQWLGLLGRVTTLDSSVFIGVPLLALAALTVVWLRRRRVVLVAAAVLIISMLLSLGGHLKITDTRTNIPLPWRLFDHLPVLTNILPIRFMVVGYLALGFLVACFFSELPRRRDVALRLVGAAALACALVPLIPTLPYPTGQYAVPTFFTDGSVARLNRTGSVLVSPYLANDPAVWQAVAGMPYRTQLALAFVPGPGGHRWGADLDQLGQDLRALTDLGRTAPAALGPDQRAAFISDLKAHDVHAVVVGPSVGQAQVVQLFTDLIGHPGESVGGVVVWFDVDPAALS